MHIKKDTYENDSAHYYVQKTDASQSIWGSEMKAEIWSLGKTDQVSKIQKISLQADQYLGLSCIKAEFKKLEEHRKEKAREWAPLSNETTLKET